MIMMGKHESFKVDKDSVEGVIEIGTLVLRMAQSKGFKIDGKYQYDFYIKNGHLYWRLDKIADGTE